MKPKTPKPNEAEERFKKSLASVLSASPERIRESRALAKREKPSLHTKYTLVREEGRS